MRSFLQCERVANGRRWGEKRSLLTEGHGIPIGLSVEGANRHDMKMVRETIENNVIDRLEPTEKEPQGMCLDKGYDYQAKATVEEWHANLAVNLWAPALMIQAALPLLRQSKGRVINVSSGAGEKAYPGWGVYCTAKAGLNMLTQVQAQEEPDITLVAVKPGVVDTEMQAAVRELGKAGMPESSHAYFVSLYERGKLLAPDMPGKVIAFLALNAPQAWSGECLIWNDEKVKALMAE